MKKLPIENHLFKQKIMIENREEKKDNFLMTEKK